MPHAVTTKNGTFFIWNFIVAFTSSILPTIDSLCVNIVGNLPALLSPGPTMRGICLINESDARNASYFLATEQKIFVTTIYCLLLFNIVIPQIKKKVSYCKQIACQHSCYKNFDWTFHPLSLQHGRLCRLSSRLVWSSCKNGLLCVDRESMPTDLTSRWVSNCLTAHQHNTGYSVP